MSLAFVIGADGGVGGWAVADDVSARDFREATLVRQKAGDIFCPWGPWVTTADEVPDPYGLRLRTWVNGELRQDAMTSELIFRADEILATLNRTIRTQPGDLVLTGTPSGVGLLMDPPGLLEPGDRVRIRGRRSGRDRAHDRQRCGLMLLNMDDYRRAARRRLPRPVYDVMAGGAGDEVTLQENELAFRRITLRPRALADVATRDLGTTVLGQQVSMPLLGPDWLRAGSAAPGRRNWQSPARPPGPGPCTASARSPASRSRTSRRPAPGRSGSSCIRWPTLTPAKRSCAGLMQQAMPLCA